MRLNADSDKPGVSLIMLTLFGVSLSYPISFDVLRAGTRTSFAGCFRRGRKSASGRRRAAADPFTGAKRIGLAERYRYGKVYNIQCRVLPRVLRFGQVLKARIADNPLPDYGGQAGSLAAEQFTTTNTSCQLKLRSVGQLGA